MTILTTRHGRVRCPQNPPPSLRNTPRQLAPRLQGLKEERLKPGTGTGPAEQPGDVTAVTQKIPKVRNGIP